MASSRGRYSLTTPARYYTSPSSQQQQRPSRRDPINITKATGSPSISSTNSHSSSSSASSSSFSSSQLSSPPSSHQHQNHHEIPSAFRRSMSPIGEAAFAVRNFLRRKRGNTFDGNNQTAFDIEAANPHDQSLQYRAQQHQQQQQRQQRPSLTMQSFVLVGGADTTTASKTAASPKVIYDIDMGSFSDSESVPISGSVSRCQSPVPTIMTSNLSSSSPSTNSGTFSQAMKSRFGRERTPTSPSTSTPTGTPTVLSPSSSVRRSRSRNPSAPDPETLPNGSATVGGTGLLAATAASMRKKLNRRSISADNIPLSTSSPSPSSLPRPLKTNLQAQAQKLADAQGGAGEVGGGGNISSGMSMQNSHSSSKDKNSGGAGRGGQGGGTVTFQDARNGGDALRQQQGANNTNAASGGRRNNKSNKNAAEETLNRSNTIDSSRDGDDDNVNPMDVDDGTLRSDESSSVDASDMSTPVGSLEDEDKSTTTSLRAAEKKRLHRQQKIKQLQQNSIEFLSAEHMRSRPPDGISDSNPPARSSLSKTIRRKSDSTLFSSRVGSNEAASRSCMALNTSLALENLEKEIDALKAKEALLQGNVVPFSVVAHKAKSTDDCRQSGLKSTRREAKILLVSSSALPTQFYDSPKTRSVLRTYLTSPGLDFDEMIEYGFPSEAFMSDDGDDDDAPSEDPSSSQQKAAAELTPSCRFLTLRITLTPWHARADESTLYGPSSTTGRQLQFKAMVNRFFSRPGSTTTTGMMTTPLSSPSTLTLVGETGATASPKVKPLATSVSLSALDAAEGSGTTTSASAKDVSTSRPASRAAESRNTSRSNSRASSPRRDRPSPPSSYRSIPAAATDHPCESSITLLLPSHIPSPNYVPSHVPTTTKEGDHTPRLGRRLFSPTPSSSSSHSMIPLPVGTSSTSQLPRKGSLTALSIPLGSLQQQQQQPTSPTTPSGHAPMIPPRRKGSTPALFFTAPPTSPTSSLRSASSPDQKVYPSPSSRAAQTYGFNPPPRRPSDQSDAMSTGLASARGLDNSESGARYLREKASFDTGAQSKRQHPRYPLTIHIKQQPQQQQAVLSSPSSTPSPPHCPSSYSGGGRSQQGNHSRLPIPDHHQQQQQPKQQHHITFQFSEQDSEEQIYECYHVAGLDNMYRSTTSRTQPTVEKWIHPPQPAPHQSFQQHQPQHSMRQGKKLFQYSAQSDDKGSDEGQGGQLSSSAMPSGAAEQTPLSAAPPRIQAKNQRRRGGGSYDGSSTTTASRNGPTELADRDHFRRQNYTNVAAKGEEEEMDEYDAHVGDHSFEGALPADGLEELNDEEVRVAAARVGGYWRPIECHQTSTMKTFAFP